eukprot:7483950-Heterocapsa_arctica.AAC.1
MRAGRRQQSEPPASWTWPGRGRSRRHAIAGMQGRWEAQPPRRQGRGTRRPRAPGIRTPPGRH